MDEYTPVTKLEAASIPVAPPSWRQLGVLVLDGSESMTWDLARPDDSIGVALPAKTKAAAVDRAVRDLVGRLKVSRKRANFSIASLSFNNQVTDLRPPRDVTEIDGMESFDPTAAGIGGTELHTGLNAAYEIVEQWFRDEEVNGLPLSAVILVMSDGEDAMPQQALDAAERLKTLPNTLVGASLFATAGEPASGGDLLEALASEPRLYQTVFGAEQLRDFFTASITVATRMMVPAGDSASTGDFL